MKSKMNKILSSNITIELAFLDSKLNSSNLNLTYSKVHLDVLSILIYVADISYFY